MKSYTSRCLRVIAMRPLLANIKRKARRKCPDDQDVELVMLRGSDNARGGDGRLARPAPRKWRAADLPGTRTPLETFVPVATPIQPGSMVRTGGGGGEHVTDVCGSDHCARGAAHSHGLRCESQPRRRSPRTR